MSCTGDFLPKIKLRRNDAAGDIIAQSAGHSQALALNGSRAGNDDHTVEMTLCIGFIQQRDVDAKPVFPGFRNFDQSRPPRTDSRMKDRLKIFASSFISEYALSQSPAIRCSIFKENTRSETLADG